MKKLLAVLLISSPCYAGLITHTDYTSGNTITASGQNANENAIVNEFNGNIDNTNIKSGAAIAVNKLAAGTANKLSITDNSGFISTADNSITSGSTMTITGLVTFSTITFSTGTSGILGTQTNNTANPGIVGEYISSTTIYNVKRSASNGHYQDLLSMTLSAGDWDVTAQAGLDYNCSNQTTFTIGISTTSGDTNGGLIPMESWVANGFSGTGGANPDFAPSFNSCEIPLTIANHRVSINTSTTVYLKVESAFSVGTPGSYGRLSARRVR